MKSWCVPNTNSAIILLRFDFVLHLAKYGTKSVFTAAIQY